MIQWTKIIAGSLQVYFRKTKLENDPIILSYWSQKINIFDFSIFEIFHFRIPVSILSLFRPLTEIWLPAIGTKARRKWFVLKTNELSDSSRSLIQSLGDQGEKGKL